MRSVSDLFEMSDTLFRFKTKTPQRPNFALFGTLLYKLRGEVSDICRAIIYVIHFQNVAPFRN